MSKEEFLPKHSTLIKAMVYDDDECLLAVVFHNTPEQAYVYQNIQPVMWRQLKSAESVGKFFLANIKPNKDKYPFVKAELNGVKPFTNEPIPTTEPPKPKRQPRFQFKKET